MVYATRNQQNSYTYKFTVVEGTYKKICEAQATSNPSLEKGIGQKIPHLAIKLLSTVIFWDRERLFSLRV